MTFIFTMVGLALIGAACMTFGMSATASAYFEPGPQRDLAEAAARGRTDKIDKLLSQGAQINFQGKEGMTALTWTIIHQNKKGYAYLLEKGANPNLQMTRSIMTEDGFTDGNSAMSFSAMHEDPWYLEVTLKHGGNPNLVNPVRGTPVIVQCIMLLDRRDPKPRLVQLKMLIAAGADLNSRDRDSYTPMMNAAFANRYDMVYIMLAAGADPTIKAKTGTTIAIVINRVRTDPKSELYQWRAKVIDLLKSKGIDVESGR
jgi:ankyrin repeat protein